MAHQCCRLLRDWVAGKPLTSADFQQLAVWELEDKDRSLAFGISPANAFDVIERRSRLWQSVYPEVRQFFQKNTSLSEAIVLETLWNLWLPLGMQLATKRQILDRPLIQGILGLQGTGKTTLGAIIALILHHLGYEAASLSLDDLYKTHAERQHLQEEDPRLLWRGPPGTHDLELGITVLDQLHQSKGLVEIPRFDKSAWGGKGDRIEPEIFRSIDIVLFEGWFVGTRPIDNPSFENPPPPIKTAADRAFARTMNEKLREYLPLWERLDCLLVIYPTDYRFSKQWRQQAEREAIAAGKSGMTDAEIDAFVEYFWRSLHPELFVKPLLMNPDAVDLAIEIDRDRSVKKIYRPRPGFENLSDEKY